MTRLRRCGAVLAAAATVGLVASGPAIAADEITVDHVQSERGQVSLLLSTDGVPGGLEVDASAVSVEINGSAVESTAELVEAGDIERSTVLVLDVSQSMQKEGKFQAATTALNAFLDSVPEDVAVGLVTFAGKVQESIAPTTEHQAVRDALAAVQLKRGTSVYDGIVEGVRLLGTDGARSLLVLSDGADMGSEMTLDVATITAKEAEATVDVVSLGVGVGVGVAASADRADELASIAEATGGSVIPADAAALTTVFNERAQALARQFLVSFEAPAGTSADIDIDVTLQAGGQTFHDSAFANLGAGFEVPDVVTSGKALVGKPAMLIGASALALGLIALLYIAINGAASTRSVTDQRMDDYFGAGAGAKKSGKGSRKAAASSAELKGSAVAFTSKVISANAEVRVSRRLAGAGSSLTVPEWILVHFGIFVGAGLVGLILGGWSLCFLGLVGGLVLPWFYLKWKHGRRLSAFNGQLAQTLGMMAGGLQAGLSLPQAVDTVVSEGHEPMAGELRRALVEQRLGIDITEGLESIAERMESEDFGWVVMAIRIQREVGGNLAEILHTVADTLREREYLRRQVKALSAEGRLSGYILAGLPPLIFFYMTFANPDYVALLYTTVPGYVILGLASFLLALGSFAMAKLATVEV